MAIGFLREKEEKASAVVTRTKTKAVAVCRENRKLIQGIFREGGGCYSASLGDVTITSIVILLGYFHLLNR